jgi:Ferritin-like domain
MIGPSQMLTTSGLSRARFVRRVGGGAVLLAGGAALGVAAPPASARQAADEPSEGDLATIRLLASGELLAQAFYTSALASKKVSKAEAADLERALEHERDHYIALKQTLGDAAPLADDFEFAFPKGAFVRRGRMLRMGTAIETALAGTCARAAATASTLELRTLLAQVAVSEAQHVAVLNRIRGAAQVPSFPELFDVEQASAALGPLFGD